MSTHYKANAEPFASANRCPYTGLGQEFYPFMSPYLDNPYPFFARARSEEPVFYNPDLDCWVISRYEDIKTILRDPATFSADIVTTPLQPFSADVLHMLREGGYRSTPVLSNTDPPAHTRMRQSVALAFTPRRVAVLEPYIRQLVQAHIDRFIQEGRADLVHQFTYDIPALVMFRLLGIPDEDVPVVKMGAEHRLLLMWGKPAPAEQARLARGLVAFWQYSAGLVAQRLRQPQDDLTSDLIRVRNGDDAVLTVPEIESIVFSLLMAGHEPTTNLLSNGLRQLLAHREVWQALCQHPVRIPNAVEELLRFDTSAVAWHRRTTRPVDMGEVGIPAGARLLLLLGSANHDEAHFPAPEQLDIHRANAKEHLSFGFGIHYCLGAPLAKLEMYIALELLTTRLPGMRLVESQAFEFLPNTTVRGPQHLWVEWDVA